ncbi:hypothetical protein GCM10023195_01180 [Actinoallomurus liliacearum]|uniref:Uncharacterized protein n=1 Tax=Actinoallomurus liliacearum TaxID=1080073 RepID=A0ABP8TBZ2_9ACTN
MQTGGEPVRSHRDGFATVVPHRPDEYIGARFDVQDLAAIDGPDAYDPSSTLDCYAPRDTRRARVSYSPSAIRYRS